MSYIIFTDGACLGNPGPGGWGVICKDSSDHVTEFGAYAADTTNNRMELTAIICALKHLSDLPPSKQVVLYSDSQYALNGVKTWRHGWVKSNWKSSSGKAVANIDLWQELCKVLDPLEKNPNWRFLWNYVAGHAGIPGNERADQIASSYANKAPLQHYQGPYNDYAINLSQRSSDSPKPKKTTSTKSKKPFGYISFVNGVFNLDKSWHQCEERVRHKKGALFRKVFSEAEMLEYKSKWAGQ